MSKDRLYRTMHENDEAGIAMRQEAQRFDLIRNAKPTEAVSSFNLFQTPKPIAERMARLADIQPNHSVLEPSAGLGRLYEAVRAAEPTARIELVEQSVKCCKILYELTEGDPLAKLRQGDFIGRKPSHERYDRVVMNPPFKMGRDIRHIRHALDMLKPGGILVSLCYDGVRQNKQLKPMAARWEVLPSGSFKSEGTGASVVMLSIIKEYEK